MSALREHPNKISPPRDWPTISKVKPLDSGGFHICFFLRIPIVPFVLKLQIESVLLMAARDYYCRFSLPGIEVSMLQSRLNVAQVFPIVVPGINSQDTVGEKLARDGIGPVKIARGLSMPQNDVRLFAKQHLVFGSASMQFIYACKIPKLADSIVR